MKKDNTLTLTVICESSVGQPISWKRQHVIVEGSIGQPTFWIRKHVIVENSIGQPIFLDVRLYNEKVSVVKNGENEKL